MTTLQDIQTFEGKYPKQLWYLFLVEMWERFCFYGMRGVLTIFMADKILGLSFSDREANLKYGAIQAFVYAFTFLGGIFADKILGYKKSLTFALRYRDLTKTLTLEEAKKTHEGVVRALISAFPDGSIALR
jgi:dipeptide/tripeptide permease